MSAAADRLAALRTAVARIEAAPGPRRADPGDPDGPPDPLAAGPLATGPLATLGHAEADGALRGGLARGGLHEVLAADPGHGGAATGFTVGLSLRLSPDARPVVWIRQDLAAREGGRAYPPGLRELGLDPERLILVQAADAAGVLRATGDALSCAALGCVILEPWGDPRGLDLTASRRIALACARSGVPALLLRSGRAAGPSAARTRWILRAAASGPSEAWGAPLLDAELARNRSGRTGRWTMEWSRDAGLFRAPIRDSLPEIRPAHPRPALPPAADRPLAAPGALRRAG